MLHQLVKARQKITDNLNHTCYKLKTLGILGFATRIFVGICLVLASSGILPVISPSHDKVISAVTSQNAASEPDTSSEVPHSDCSSEDCSADSLEKEVFFSYPAPTLFEEPPRNRISIEAFYFPSRHVNEIVKPPIS